MIELYVYCRSWYPAFWKSQEHSCLCVMHHPQDYETLSYIITGEPGTPGDRCRSKLAKHHLCPSSWKKGQQRECTAWPPGCMWAHVDSTHSPEQQSVTGQREGRGHSALEGQRRFWRPRAVWAECQRVDRHSFTGQIRDKAIPLNGDKYKCTVRPIWWLAGNPVWSERPLWRESEGPPWGWGQGQGVYVAWPGHEPLALLIMGPPRDFKWDKDIIVSTLGRLLCKQDEY